MSPPTSEDKLNVTALEGKTVKTAEHCENDKSICLEFTDGTSCTFYGLGYDGLWDEVYLRWADLVVAA